MRGDDFEWGEQTPLAEAPGKKAPSLRECIPFTYLPLPKPTFYSMRIIHAQPGTLKSVRPDFEQCRFEFRSTLRRNFVCDSI